MTVPPREAATDLTGRVRALAEEVVADMALYLVEVSVRGQKGSRVVEVYVDSDGALDIDQVAAVSRELDFLLETGDVIDGKYHLNVSSPGVDRPLTLARQYRKNVGRPLQVHYRRPDGTGNTEVTGELKAVDDEGIDVAASAKETRRIAFGDIIWAKVKLPW